MPLLEWIEYDTIAAQNTKGHRPWTSTRVVKRFGLEATLEQRCWVSGVQLYLVPYCVLPDAMTTIWGVTRDHLVCERNGGAGNGASNIVFVGAHINKKLGHNPLPLKLLLKQELAKQLYPRDEPTQAVLNTVIGHIIHVEDGLRLGNSYPWQPWAYSPGTQEYKIATAFHAEMRAAETEFLALEDEGRRQWIAEFRWRW